LEIAFLIWAALVPVFTRLRPGGDRANAWLGFLTGCVFYSGHLYWVAHATGGGVLALIVSLSAINAGVFWIFGWLNGRTWSIPSSALVWALVEYLRSRGALAFSWGYPGHALFQWDGFLQAVFWIGVPGLSFLIIAVNLSLAQWLSTRTDAARGNLRFHSLFYLFASILFMILLHGYGKWVIRSLEREPEPATAIRVGLIQGNFSQEEKETAEPFDALSVYLTLSEKSLQEKPDLIIWPESAITVPINLWPVLVQKITDFVNLRQVEMLTGTVYGEPADNGGWRYRNRVFLFSPNQSFSISGEEVDLSHVPFYDKMHLVPYGEWIPLGRYWPFNKIETLIEEAGAGIFEPGTQPVIFHTRQGIAFAAAVCIESTLPGYFADMRRRGARFVATITNDAWYKRSVGLEQHFNQCLFRAAENRFPVVRAANTGITGVIGPTGNILKTIPPHQPGYCVFELRFPSN